MKCQSLQCVLNSPGMNELVLAIDSHKKMMLFFLENHNVAIISFSGV